MKQGQSLNNRFSELQQQACSQRWELEDAHHEYVEFQGEEVRLQEEWVMKEKEFRDSD